MKKIISVILFSLIIVFTFSKVYVEDGMVVFEYEDRTADSVFVAGTFNNWSTSAWEMEYYNGVWVYVAELQPGVYEFKYVVNGTDWYEDPESPDYVPDPYGGRNSKFELVLEDGELKIVGGEAQEGKASIISGKYEFGLKTKLEDDTGFFASPQVTNEVILSINPNIQNADLELKIGASSSNIDSPFKVYGMKAAWMQEHFSLGAFYKLSINPNYNFYYQNPETKLPGFGFIFNYSDFYVGADLLPQENKVKFLTFADCSFYDFRVGLLFDTVDATSLVIRGEAYDFFTELDLEDWEFDSVLIGYEKADSFGASFLYAALDEYLTVKGFGIYNEFDLDGAVYYETKEENFYAFQIGGGYTLLESYRIGGDLYFNGDGKSGFNLNFKIDSEDFPVKVKVGFGNNIKVDAKPFDPDKYFTLSVAAEF